MYCEDLTAYRFHLPFAVDEVQCVGWLDKMHEFNIGIPPKQFVEKLIHLTLLKTETFDIHVNVVRGVHPCNLCAKQDIRLSAVGLRSRMLGMSELWIPRAGGWYAAPSMIVHYVVEHQYLPPPDFVNSVFALDPMSHYVAEEVCMSLKSVR